MGFQRWIRNDPRANNGHSEGRGLDVTLTGGDPLYSPESTTELAKAITDTGHSVWLYTGFTYEEILASPRLSLPLPILKR